MARMEIMSGSERRRRWSDEAKLRILAEADEPGARIGDVARRHDIHPGQIRLWRQSFSYADRPTVFLPVEITEEVGVSQSTTAATRPAIVEILLRNGRRLKVPVDVELKLLGPLVACVEAA
ncbi:MAG: IS66-like element accessory protein TnpA [Pseudorhizobium sp.]